MLCLPAWAAMLFGEDAIEYAPIVEYDARPPQDVNAAAAAMTAIAGAMKSLADALDRFEYDLDAPEIISRFGVPAVARELEGTVIDVTWDEDDAKLLSDTLDAAAKAGLKPVGESVIAELNKSGVEFEAAPAPTLPAAGQSGDSGLDNGVDAQ